MTADRPATEPRHDITDPNAPDGYKCGDPACEVHGLRARMHRELRAAGASETTASAVSGYHPADRPATEPRPTAHTFEQVNWDNVEQETRIGVLQEMVNILLNRLDERAEAAQGAAPHTPQMTIDGPHCERCMVEMESEGAAPRAEGRRVCWSCEGEHDEMKHSLAAPRAEGLDVERLERAIAATSFSIPVTRTAVEAIADAYSRPSDGRVPESEER